MTNKFDFAPWLVVPEGYTRLIDMGMTNLGYWNLIDAKERIFQRQQGLSSRYPRRELVPFAIRKGSDTVACWESGKGAKVIIIDDYELEGFEEGGQFETFWDWFKAAVEEVIIEPW